VKQPSKGQDLAARAHRAFRNGNTEAAVDFARRALEEAPRDPSVLHALAELAASAGSAEEAGQLLGQAIALHTGPAPVSWHARLGEIRAQQGKVEDALRAYQEALSLAPDDKAAWIGVARAKHAQSDLRGAIEGWQRVAALDPDAWEPENDLGAALMEMGDWDRAEAAFARAGAATFDRPVVVVNRATLDIRRGRRREAIATFDACVARHPAHAPGHAGLGLALRDEGRFEDAAAALRRARQLAPDDATYAFALGRVLLEGGDAEGASAEAREYLALHPGNSGALALEALARVALGDAAAVAWLFDYPLLVSAARLPLPPGFADLRSFNTALARHAAHHPTLVTAPASHATVRGLHSGSLQAEPRGPVSAFEPAIESAVASYWHRLCAATDHPFALHRPRDVLLTMWCVVLEPGGHQIPHIHPASWLSGVYYPRIPEAIATGAGPAGWLEFGQPDRELPGRVAPPVHRVRPEEGLVVIFPSYLYHRTIPFDQGGTRISVAFDVVPVQ
jgi:Flp pilus assembly protein TadD